jgi:uncharacterized protein (DUF1684 family)
MARRVALLGSLALLMLAARIACAAVDDYAAGILKWREEFDADLRNAGVLALVGRYLVPEGDSTVGSDPLATVALPEGAPERLGVLRRHGQELQLLPTPGTERELQIDEQPASDLIVLSTARGQGVVSYGEVSFSVRPIGADFYALVRDERNPAIAAFKGSTWFAVDPSFRIAARFIPYEKPESIAVPMTHVDSPEHFDSTGAVSFELHGTTLRLRSFVAGTQLLIMFRDRTNGKESYGGGRFLSAPLPQDGATVLDFNKAYNPYCAVNDYAVCAIAPAENHLPVRITAGARYSGHTSRE